MSQQTSKFQIRQLSVLAYANGFTLWHYKHTGEMAQIDQGFFSEASDMLTPGDMIMISARNTGEAKGGMFTVAIVEGGAVAVEKMF